MTEEGPTHQGGKPPRLGWFRGSDGELSQVKISLAALVISGVALVLSVVISIVSLVENNAQVSASSAGQRDQQRAERQQGEALQEIAGALLGMNPTASAAHPAPSPEDSGCRSDGTRFGGTWGPERPIYTDAAFPMYPLFDSVRDNSVIGDERAFYAIKDASSTEDGGWLNSIRVERNHTYLLRIYVRNDAVSQPATPAAGTKVMVNLPTCTGTSIQSDAFITSDDAFPAQVYSGIGLYANTPFNVTYVDGSAALYNNADHSPFYFSNVDHGFLTSHGQLIGFDTMDGVVNSGYTYATYIYFKIRPQFAN